MDNTFMLDFSNTIGGFINGITSYTDLFTASIVIIIFVGILIVLSNRRTKSGAT